LEGVTWRDTHLESVTWRDAHLEGVTWRDAQLESVTWRCAYLKGVTWRVTSARRPNSLAPSPHPSYVVIDNLVFYACVN